MPEAIPLYLVFEASAEVTHAADAAPENDEEQS